MIDVRQAVAKAKEYASVILEPPVQNLLVEGVVSSESHWDVTLGFDARRPRMRSALAEELAGDVPREFKTFRVDKSSGEVTGMHIAFVG